jgi:hypothetical protein
VSTLRDSHDFKYTPRDSLTLWPRNWFHNAAAAQMLAQLDKLTHAYGHVEVIRLTPIPVAHLYAYPATSEGLIQR